MRKFFEMAATVLVLALSLPLPFAPSALAESAPEPDTPAGARRISGPSLIFPVRGSMIREGWADIDCDVDASGQTNHCILIEHMGFQSFADAALAYVSAGIYSPAMHNGSPVPEPHHRFHVAFALN